MLWIGYAGSSAGITFVRSVDGSVTATIPSAPDPESAPFDIALAIAHEHCDVPVEHDADCYRFAINTRAHFRHAVTLACLHLNMHDDERIVSVYRDSPVA